MSVSKLQRFVEGSDLSQSDQDMWLKTLEVMDDEQAAAVLGMFTEDPAELETFTRNLKLKQVALATGDLGLLDQILGEEVAELS